MLFHVYADPKPEGYFINEPFGIYRTILDADWLLYILLPFLLAILVAGLMVGWHLHEIPKHKADQKRMRQADLVSALTLLGLFLHWVWAVALFLAFVDWNAAEDWFVRVLRRSRTPQDEDDAAQSGVAEAAGAVERNKATGPIEAGLMVVDKSTASGGAKA